MAIPDIITELKTQRDRLNAAIGILEGTAPASLSKLTSVDAGHVRVRGIGRPPKVRDEAPQPSPANDGQNGRKGRLTEEGRRRLSEAMKRRWRQRRAAKA